MGYVMVPVPEEHVEEAMQMVLRITSKAKLSDWDLDSFSALFHAVDEPSRSVMSAVAKGTLASRSVTDTEVADAIEFTAREVLGVIRELNERAQTDQRVALVVIKADTEVLPNGRSRERRMVSMEPAIAELVRGAEQLEMRATPHPLMGGGR